MFVINNGLEYFTNLGIAYIRHSSFLIPHILFVYKLVLVFLKLGSKHLLMFCTPSELSITISYFTPHSITYFVILDVRRHCF